MEAFEPSILRATNTARGAGRRSWFWWAAALGLAALALVSGSARRCGPAGAEAVFLDDLEYRALTFFIDHTDAATGLTRDRAPADGSASKAPASIAASGFALTAWCIGADRGWLGRDEALRRTLTTLRFADESAARERGWFYHFIDVSTGKRHWRCEASTIDTALFLQGAVLAREYFDDVAVSALVDRIYARVDWRWALDGGSTLRHGWNPERGFLASRWDSYSELMGLYLLGLGAPAAGLPAESWSAWSRRTVAVQGRHAFISCPPLFTHQYSHAWFDFRGVHDGIADYWQNSVDVTLAQREWCASLTSRFSRWSPEMWGITASDSADGYIDWGGPNNSGERLDGTLVPCAPAGSLPFAPRECLAALQAMRDAGGAALWGRYGFADAFNPQNGWVARDVIAIDVGISLLMAENLRSGFVWKHFMRAPEVRRGMTLAGFVAHDDRKPFVSTVLARARSAEYRRALVPMFERDAKVAETCAGRGQEELPGRPAEAMAELAERWARPLSERAWRRMARDQWGTVRRNAS
jgi:hypothetical protein